MEDFNKNIQNEKHSRFWTGLIFVLIGVGLLLQQISAPFPHWLFTWPMILIIIGLISGIKHRFRNFSWFIIAGSGVVFLMGEVFNDMDMRTYMWPIIIIGVGLIFMFRPRRRSRCFNRWQDRYGKYDYDKVHVFGDAEIHTEDVIDSVSVFSGVKKTVTSKNFKGGEICCFMGGAEVNLSQADITGTIVIDITLIFGGAKLIIPPHWEVRSESVAIFAGIDDKRPVQASNFDPSKVIIIRGTSIFGGIEIKSY